MYDVIIIGGGAAGLMAAKILSENNKAVLLLEAKPTLGGRIHCAESFSFDVQAGAEFIHGNLETTFALLEEAGLKKQKLTGKFCRVKAGNWSMDDEQAPHWDMLLKKLKECKKDMTVDEFLQSHLLQRKYSDTKQQFKRYVEGYDTADTKKASVFAIRKEMENEDEDQYWPAKGYHAMLEYLIKKSKEKNAVIHANEPVKKVVYNEQIEVITTLKKYHCKKIIIAVPVGVLQLNKNHRNFIEFPSSLKSHIAAARKIGNGGVIKFLVEFDIAFWLNKKFLKEKNISAPSYIFSDAIIPTWWTQYPSQKPLLTGWVGGPSSFKMKNYSSEKLKELAIKSLAYLFSSTAEEINKRIKNFMAVDWIKEPYIFGAYSYATLPTSAARTVLQQPYKDAFYFAGEYIPDDSTSTVDEALKSAVAAASQVLKSL